MRSVSRVHWLLHHLPSWFKRIYTLSFDYRYHQYTFYRIREGNLIDIFIVIRTSKRCFRLVYANRLTSYVGYRSCTTSKDCSNIMVCLSKYHTPYL